MSSVHLPKNLKELWTVLDKEPDAVFYAGGTDLLVKMRSESKAPDCLICLERVKELNGVRDEGDVVFIAAATTHSRLLDTPLIRREFPVLVQALEVLGSPPVRHMGTIGGNIVTASPAGDTLPPLYVLQAEVEIGSHHAQRRVPIGVFIQGPGLAALEKGEIVIGVRLVKNSRWNVQHYEKVGRRKAQACSVASMAALMEVAESGEIRAARLAWGAVGPTVVTSEKVEGSLCGEKLCLETLRRAAPIAEDAVSPISDVRAGADYRRTLAGALLLRLNDYANVPGTEA